MIASKSFHPCATCAEDTIWAERMAVVTVGVRDEDVLLPTGVQLVAQANML